jgi:DNA-binding NarL/FixJ family response regulator
MVPKFMADHPLIRVVLADDHTMVREALARILAESGAINVVAQANNGAEAIESVKRTDPDVVVLDYSMPKHDAVHVIERLLRYNPQMKVLVLTVHESIHYAVRVLEHGALGYLVKSAAVEELVDAIRTVRRGRIYLSAGISPEVINYLRRPKRQRVGLEALSQREFDFLRIMGTGKSLQDCAREMNIGTSTASTYRARIMEKLNLQTTAELIRFALEQGLVE